MLSFFEGFFPPFSKSLQFLQICLNWYNTERWVIQVLMLTSVLSQKLLLPQCWPLYKDTFSPNSTGAQRLRSDVFFNLTHHWFSETSIWPGQIYCMVCHIHLPSIYVRKWQVKFAHTGLNPHVHSLLLIPHYTVNNLESYRDSNPKYSKELCCNLLDKQVLEGIMHSTMCQVFSHQYSNKKHTTALQCYTHTLLTIAHSSTTTPGERHVQNLCFLFWISHILPLYASCMYEFSLQDCMK